MSSNQEEHKNHILYLIDRVQSGEASEEEICELDEWYEQSSTGEKYADGMSAAEKLQAKDKMLHRINSRIYKEAVPVQKNKSYKYFKRYALAAVIMLVAGLGWLFYPRNTNSVSIVQNTVKILPGGNKAVLTLADGGKVSLTDAANGFLVAQPGTHITKTGNGQLIYEADNNTSFGNATAKFNTIEVPVGGQWQATLPDGSHVWLNALSSIRFPTKFTNSERRVELKGEAYFEIAHNKTKPFRVTSLGQTVEVHGTHFNVMAYADERSVKTTLLEGSVKVSKGGSSTMLTPGQQAQVDASGIKLNTAVDVEDVVAWKDGYFKFGESLESVMNKLARWYDVKVAYAAGINKQKQFGGKISRSKDLSSALRIIELTGKVHFEIEGRRILVMN